MVINSNLLAMNAQRQFNINNNSKQKSTEKLSSGYRINRSADDAAGLAISEKMRRQIRGLTQGVENTQDGISLCQVADGALNEVDDMLHRITELSVQAANGTNSDEDREYLQKEVRQLILEIDRISETTEFNGQTLFEPQIYRTGTFMTREDAIAELSSGVFKTISSDIVDADGNLILEKDAANAMFAAMSCYYIQDDLEKNYNSGIMLYDGINGTMTNKTANMITKYAEALDVFGTYKGLDVSSDTSKIKLFASYYATTQEAVDGSLGSEKFFSHCMTYTSSVMYQFKRDVDERPDTTPYWKKYDAAYAFAAPGDGQNIYIPLYSALGKPEGLNHSVRGSLQTSKDAYITSMKYLCEENPDPVSDTVQYYLDNLSDINSVADFYAHLNSDGKETVVNKRNWWIQSGTEAGDGMNLEIDAINSSLLRIKNLNVSTQDGANNAIEAVKGALEKVSSNRSKIGAQQNRLKHTVANENNIIENTTAAESLIRDTDMADEMTKLSVQNILEQAGISMMAQANQSNQGVLQLLQ